MRENPKTVIELLDISQANNESVNCSGFCGYEFLSIYKNEKGIEIFYVDYEDYSATWSFKDYEEARAWLTSDEGECVGQMTFNYEPYK